MSDELQRVAVRDVTAILRVAVRVTGFQFDASIMEQPEFTMETCVVFRCQQFGGRPLETSWQICRSFGEFQGLDAQLRRAFPLLMANIRSPRVHKRRSLFRLHKRESFLARRCEELNAYLAKVMETSSMRLSRFVDPRAPLVLRYFCDYDQGFGRGAVEFQANPLESCVLCLDHIAAAESPSQQPPYSQSQSNISTRRGSLDEDGKLAFDQVADADASVRSQEWELKQQRELRQEWRSGRLRSAASRYDELEANLLDDRARNMAMCLKFECACQYSSFHVTHNKMTRILQQRGFRQLYRPQTEGATALYCILYQLQQYNDLDKRLYDALTGFPATKDDADGSAHEQLRQGVAVLRQALANYGLLHIYALETPFKTTAVELKKKLHELKSKHHHRMGAVELQLLSTMLDLSITLITNDHEGTEQLITPLEGLKPIRHGGRISLTLGYILPTVFNINGFYLLAAEQEDEADQQDPLSRSRTRTRSRPMSFRELQDAKLEAVAVDLGPPGMAVEVQKDESIAATVPLDPGSRRRMWLGVEEMDRCLIALIDELMRSELTWLRPFDHDVAETLNKALLDAVWDDCQHNPSLFHLFQRQARQFGKARTSAHFFFQYLEVAFGLEGAAYLVDFLLHVLPEEDLRKQLLRARWFRVRRHLVRRVSAPAR